MTLVVARIIEDEIFVISDTKITDPNEIVNNPLTRAIKAIIIHPNIFIAYAGDFEVAKSALSCIYNLIDSQPDFSVVELLKILFDSHRESKGETDYIIGLINYFKPELIRITNGEIESNLNATWIGKKEGYSLYQEHYHNFLASGNSQIASMQDAFTMVIENESIPEVGNYTISIETNKDIDKECCFLLYSINIVNYSGIVHCKGSKEFAPLTLGSPESGAYSLSYFGSINPNKYAVALYFPHGEFGVLFYPRINLDGIIYKKVTAEQFTSKIIEEFDIPLRGFKFYDENTIEYCSFE